MSDPRVNIIIVFLTDEEIDVNTLRLLKRFVGASREGAIVILRNQIQSGSNTLQESLDEALRGVRAKFETYPGK